MKIELPISLRINRSRAEIFDAFVNPEKIAQFLCQSASGQWSTGKQVLWHFEPKTEALDVLELIPNQKLRFKWDGDSAGYQTDVTVDLIEVDAQTTQVKIFETGWPSDQSALRNALDHACGWENTLCNLKAWIEHGIDLRK